MLGRPRPLQKRFAEPIPPLGVRRILLDAPPRGLDRLGVFLVPDVGQRDVAPVLRRLARVQLGGIHRRVKLQGPDVVAVAQRPVRHRVPLLRWLAPSLRVELVELLGLPHQLALLVQLGLDLLLLVFDHRDLGHHHQLGQYGLLRLLVRSETDRVVICASRVLGPAHRRQHVSLSVPRLPRHHVTIRALRGHLLGVRECVGEATQR